MSTISACKHLPSAVVHNIFAFFALPGRESSSLGLELGSFRSCRLSLLGLSSSVSLHFGLAIFLLLLLNALLAEHLGLLALLLGGFNFLLVLLELLFLGSLEGLLLILLLLAFDLATDHVVSLELDAVRELDVEDGSLIRV